MRKAIATLKRAAGSPPQKPTATIRTSGGAEFDSSADDWVYRDGVDDVALHFTELSGLSTELVDSARATLRWYAEHKSPGHLTNLFNRLLHFVRCSAATGGVLARITAADLINYRATLSGPTTWYLGTLAGLLKKWHSLGYPGIDADVILLFKQLRLKGNAKGVAVLTMDPVNGPYTHIESEALQCELNSAYATGEVEMSAFVLAWLYILLGQRNKQHAALKVCDVVVTRDADGNLSYSVMMPSAKRGMASPRHRLVERPLVAQFGEILADYAQRVRQEFAGLLPDPANAPLFPSESDKDRSEGFAFHPTANGMGQRLASTLERLSVQSERTGMPVNVNARRFRRTIATRAAEEGYGPLVIAGLLDHTDTQNVGVYTANSPAIIDRIDRATAMAMAPLAQAFAGVLVDGDDGDPDQQIIDLRIDRSGKAMGKCGADGFCGFAAPIACYTCRSFKAWVDGPHEAVLSYLLERRDRLVQTSDKRIASINDRTIYAVAAVVQGCSELKAEAQGRLCG